MALVDNLNELLAPVVKASGLLLEEIKAVSYTHLTLPTNREV